jgi:osmotically-inducible protein OsmY
MNVSISMGGGREAMTTTTKHWQEEPQEDRDLKQRIVRYLSEMQRQPLRDIQVQVDRGHVTLTGRLSSFYEKQLCLQCFQQVQGVTRVVDQIDVLYGE